MSNYYCRLCFRSIKPEEALLFSKHITEIIQFCISEVDIKLVNNPVLCPECYDELERIFKFKKNCLEVQENIKRMMVNKAEDDDGDFDLCHIKEELMSDTWEKDGEHGAIGYVSDDELTSSHVSSINEKILIPVITKMEHCKKSSRAKPKIKYKISDKLSKDENSVDVKFSLKFCQNCKIPFSSLDEQLKHFYSNHHDIEELYQCMLCRFKSKNFASMMRHYKNYHPNCNDVNSSCFLCRTDSKNFKELFKHMRRKHSDICRKATYKCNSCDYTSKSFFSFKKHFFQSHDFTCNYCSVKRSTAPLLNKHLLKHTSNPT